MTVSSTWASATGARINYQNFMLKGLCIIIIIIDRPMFQMFKLYLNFQCAQWSQNQRTDTLLKEYYILCSILCILWQRILQCLTRGVNKMQVLSSECSEKEVNIKNELSIEVVFYFYKIWLFLLLLNSKYNHASLRMCHINCLP